MVSENVSLMLPSPDLSMTTLLTATGVGVATPAVVGLGDVGVELSTAAISDVDSRASVSVVDTMSRSSLVVMVMVISTPLLSPDPSRMSLLVMTAEDKVDVATMVEVGEEKLKASGDGDEVNGTKSLVMPSNISLVV